MFPIGSFPFSIACGQAIITRVSLPVRKFEVLSNASRREVSMLFSSTRLHSFCARRNARPAALILRACSHATFSMLLNKYLYPHSDWSNFVRHKSTQTAQWRDLFKKRQTVDTLWNILVMQILFISGDGFTDDLEILDDDHPFSTKFLYFLRWLVPSRLSTFREARGICANVSLPRKIRDD